MSRISLEEYESQADSIVNYLKDQLKKIRSGRANPAMVEDIAVEAYGAKQPIKNVANINVADAQLLTVQPWDKSLVDAVVKAIQEANLGFNATASGDLVRIPMPPLTQERRQEYVKLMKTVVEEAKISVRTLRKNILNGMNADKKEGEITEDDLSRGEKELQEKVNKSNSQIDELASEKEKDLLEL